MAESRFGRESSELGNYLQARIQLMSFSEQPQKIYCIAESLNQSFCARLLKVQEVLHPFGGEHLNRTNLEGRLRLVDRDYGEVLWVSKGNYSLSDQRALRGLPGRLIPVALLKCKAHGHRCILAVSFKETAV